MKSIWYRSAALASAIGIACSFSAFGVQTKAGDAVPQFSVTSMSGKQMFFQDMQTGGPIFIYFIRDGDSVSQQATSYINTIIRAYGTSRTTWYGVINAKEDRARSYLAETNPAFRLERDENVAATRSFGVTSSPTIVEINGKGIVEHVWKGYSEMNLNSLNRAVAKASRKPVQDIDLSKAPSTAQYGLDYNNATGATRTGTGG